MQIEEYITDFSELNVAERTTVFSLNGSKPLSTVRDDQATANTGTVTSASSEFELNHAAANDFARLSSQARGRYVPGRSSIVGIGVRAEGDITSGDGKRIWGYFDMVKSGRDNTQDIEDGAFFGEDKDGIFVQLIKNQVSKFKVYAADWNVNPGYQIDLTKGNIFQIEYVYYGYGPIKFFVMQFDNSSKRQKEVLLHTQSVGGETSFEKPNLLVGALVDSTDTTDDFSLFVGGRQYSINGKHEASNRVTSEKASSVTVGTSAYVPLVSFRKKTLFKQISTELASFQVITDNDVFVQLRIESTLTGAVFGDVSDTDNDEVALEVDTTATAIDVATGIKVYEVCAVGGIGNQVNVRDSENLAFDVGDDITVTLCAKAVTTSATVSAVFRMNELW